MSKTCSHGQLARSCGICERDATIARLRGENEELSLTVAAIQKSDDAFERVMNERDEARKMIDDVGRGGVKLRDEIARLRKEQAAANDLLDIANIKPAETLAQRITSLRLRLADVVEERDEALSDRKDLYSRMDGALTEANVLRMEIAAAEKDRDEEKEKVEDLDNTVLIGSIDAFAEQADIHSGSPRDKLAEMAAVIEEADGVSEKLAAALSREGALREALEEARSGDCYCCDLPLAGEKVCLWCRIEGLLTNGDDS